MALKQGVRALTLAEITRAAGLDPSGLRRYFGSREELLLELAESGWQDWRGRLCGDLDEAHDLSAAQLAQFIVSSLTADQVFCDLLTHVPLSLEDGVPLERARRYKERSFQAYDAMCAAIANASEDVGVAEAELVLGATLGLAANLWQVSHPSPTLAALYEQVPRWGHAALNFEPRLVQLLTALVAGLNH
ncbi:MAG: TetR family transcriptional regulator [Acidimicrobiaceae bacterium]|nr:TetR family transcriptional regulator [Acidimicrobiaceae bacterium]